MKSCIAVLCSFSAEWIPCNLVIHYTTGGLSVGFQLGMFSEYSCPGCFPHTRAHASVGLCPRVELLGAGGRGGSRLWSCLAWPTYSPRMEGDKLLWTYRHDLWFSKLSTGAAWLMELELGASWQLLLLRSELGQHWRPGLALLCLCTSSLPCPTAGGFQLAARECTVVTLLFNLTVSWRLAPVSA